jgi:TolB-like protein
MMYGTASRPAEPADPASRPAFAGGRLPPDRPRAGIGGTAMPETEFRRSPAGRQGLLAGARASLVWRFLREARRRHLLRVAFVYCAVAWVTVQVATAFFPALHVPPWAISFVAAMLIIGFPVAMVLAWAYDLTPDGVQRTRAAEPAAGGASRAAAEPAAPGAGTSRAPDPAPTPASAVPGSLAVLPFVDRSPGRDFGFLGDGMAEDLISGLARIPGLRVVSRTSSFAFRAESLDVREIGERLGVAFVLEGSVQVTGERLRMTVRLVDVADGYTTWSATLSRRVDDLFLLQEELAQSILEALRWRLSPGQVPAPAERAEDRLLQSSTRSVQAYSRYLRGRARWNERTPHALRRAILHFEAATAEDPGFARAWAGLADAHAILVDHGLVDPAQGLALARDAASRALQLGADLAEAHTSAGLVHQLEWRWDAAEAALRRANSLDPTYSVARHRLALLLAWRGRFDESREQIGRASELDPVSAVIAASRAWVEYFSGNHERVVSLARETLDEHPGSVQARLPLALSLVQLGRPDEAAAELRGCIDSAGETIPLLALLAYAVGRGGHRAEAEALIRGIRERAAAEFVSPYHLGVALLGLPDPEAALAELALAITTRAPQAIHLATDPVFDTVRSDPAFARLIEAVGPVR